MADNFKLSFVGHNGFPVTVKPHYGIKELDAARVMFDDSAITLANFDTVSNPSPSMYLSEEVVRSESLLLQLFDHHCERTVVVGQGDLNKYVQVKMTRCQYTGKVTVAWEVNPVVIRDISDGTLPFTISSK